MFLRLLLVGGLSVVLVAVDALVPTDGLFVLALTVIPGIHPNSPTKTWHPA